MPNIYNADDGIIWVQPKGPNYPVYELPCFDTDGIARDNGDVVSSMCRTSGGWSASGRRRGIPAEATLTLEGYLSRVKTWLERNEERNCPVTVYLHKGKCTPGVFLAYELGELAKSAFVITSSESAMVRGMGDSGDGPADKSTKSFSLKAEPFAPRYGKLVVSVRSVAEAEALRNIIFCNEDTCFGDCGPDEVACTDGVITADMTAAATADVWFSTDGFASGAAGAADPFAADEAVTASVCFKIDADTTRVIVFRGTTDAGNPAECGYSDDSGATWTLVNIGSTNAEFFVHGGAAFALDGRHIWCCSDLGNVYFSDDYGLTWTDQAAPEPAGGAEELFCIRFADENYGMCVGGTTGASSVFLYTSDGGEHWNIDTGPAAQLLTAVHVFDALNAWTCADNGALYYTEDFGQTWTARTLPVAATALGAMDWVDQYAGSVVGNYNDGVNDHGIIYRTFNGGHDWEHYINATEFDGALVYYGLNAVWMCGYNEIYAVGEQVDSLGLIMELQEQIP